jgi:hypothetical protein
VLVDEYQDTNRLQASILLRVKPDGRGLTVVGDDAQSIYSFRAARVRNILDFPSSFTPRAEVVTLEQNYRSTQAVSPPPMPSSASRRASPRTCSGASLAPELVVRTRRSRAALSAHPREPQAACFSKAVLFHTST